MERWARAMPEVQFLAVCVESLGVARWFGQQFQFRNTVNAFIPSREYMPHGYGQLGCSGFIISDERGCFISRKTKAFLQYDEEAFRDVENILAKHLALVGSAPMVRGEEKEDSETANTSAEVSFVPPALGIESMDNEHESCAKALEDLMSKPTEESLVRAIREIEDHFAHEEALMVKHGFGGDVNNPLSAINSHIQDHRRIVQLGRDELRRLENASSVSRSSDPGSC